MAIKAKLQALYGAAKLGAKANAPFIMLGLGLVAGIATVVTACVATTKLDDIIEETSENVAKADAALVGDVTVKEGETYTQEDHDRDVKIYKRDGGVKIAKRFALPAVLGISSIVLILGGFKILNNRYISATMACEGITAAFARYREMVRKELGADADRHFRYGTKIERVIDPETGEEQIKETFPEVDTLFPDLLRFDFNACTSTEWEDRYNRRPENWWRCKSVYDWTKMRVSTYGHCFLNEVLKEFGLQEIPEGQILGWRRRFEDDPEDMFRCPDVDFGFEAIKDNNNGFDIEHLESIPLIFNCYPIYNNKEMWLRDRPFASICKPYTKRRVW